MAVEKWLGAVSLGLFVMFVVEILTFLNYLSNPTQVIQPGGKILQYISIGVAPAIILSVTSYVLARRFGSVPIGSMIVAGGVILLAGMYFANNMLANIPSEYLVTELIITPPLFMAASIPVMIVGALLFRLKPRPKKEYF